MTDLDPNLMALFSSQKYSSSEQLTRDVGLMDLIPGCILDSKIFEPCGYSLNAIVKVIVAQKVVDLKYMRTRVTVVVLSVCLSVTCTNLAPAYDVRVTK